MIAATTPKRRCAIYTRKSHEEGLDQEYNSLDAQRDAGEAFIASQRHEGWVALPTRYDDGGWTGANLERPALTALMRDIEAGKVDVVIVYKVDGLSRSLLDFVKLLQVFEQQDVVDQMKPAISEWLMVMIQGLLCARGFASSLHRYARLVT